MDVSIVFTFGQGSFYVDISFQLLGKYLGVQLLGYGNLFNFLRNCQNVFQSCHVILHSPSRE